MSRTQRLLFLLAGLSLLLSSFAAPAQSRKSVAKGSPKVTAIDANGLTALLKRDSLNAGPLLVNYWATWCVPCREEFPELVQIDKQFRPKGLAFITVSLDDLADIKTGVPKFLREMRVTTPAYLLNVADPEPAMTGVDPTWSGALPATFLYDAQGNIVYKRFGRIKPLELTAEIEKLVGSQTVMSNK
jgi:thiol-disulfide isomerase/thioredoxin